MPIVVQPVTSAEPGAGSYSPGTLLHRPEVKLGGLTLGRVDQYGCWWTMADITGWDSPASVSTATQRTHAHGAWLTTPYFSPREITVTGDMRAPDKASGRDAADRLFEAVSLYDTTLSIDEWGLERFVTVRRSGDVLWDYAGQPWDASWSVSLIAADPFRYSTTQHTATVQLGSVVGGRTAPFSLPTTVPAAVTQNTVRVTNAGNFDAAPVFTVRGPCVNPVIQQPGTGREMRFKITLGYGRWITIDTRDRSVTLDGSASRLFTMSGDWLTMPRGDTDFRYLAGDYNPDSTLTVAWRDTWQ